MKKILLYLIAFVSLIIVGFYALNCSNLMTCAYPKICAQKIYLYIAFTTFCISIFWLFYLTFKRLTS